MALFNRHKHKRRIIAGDDFDLSPTTQWANVGWQMASDEQDYDKLANEYRHDAIAHKIVAKPAQDAVRNGFRVVIPDDPTKQADYQKQLDDLKISQALMDQAIFMRRDGDGYLTIGVMENRTSDLSEPLDPDNVTAVTFLHAFGQKHIDKYLTNDDPTSPDYNKESAIVLRPQSEGYNIDKNGVAVPNAQTDMQKVIDKSRYFHISMDKFEDDETGTSILTRCQKQIKTMDIALETTGKMLREFTFKVFKSDQLMSEGNDEYRRARAEIGQIMNTESMVFMHEKDSIEKLSTPTNGIDTLFDFAWQELCAACGIPKSVMTGEQSGTLAGAGQDVINYYDSVKSLQEEQFRPEIEYILRLLMQINGDDPDSLEWHIEFNPLWSNDDKTNAEINLTNTQAAAMKINSGILSPDEARQELAGQNNNQSQAMQTTTADDSVDVTDKKSIEDYEKALKDVVHHGKKA